MDRVKLNKKAQEEMVGFVLIVVIVAVIFLVFLGISLMNDKSVSKGSKEISQFLDSTMRYTTGCALNYVPAYASVGDLIKKCYESGDMPCVSGENVCEALDKTLKEIVGASWNIGSESVYKGYKFESVYDNNSSERKSILMISEGNCSGDYRASESYISSSPGIIISSFKLCN